MVVGLISSYIGVMIFHLNNGILIFIRIPVIMIFLPSHINPVQWVLTTGPLIYKVEYVFVFSYRLLIPIRSWILFHLLNWNRCLIAIIWDLLLNFLIALNVLNVGVMISLLLLSSILRRWRLITSPLHSYLLTFVCNFHISWPFWFAFIKIF